jgi:hypothetical protein
MHTNNKQAGNVLFLILIAVVLFAALSYAVTQSTRGGGNSDSEKIKIDAAQMIQQAAQMKAAFQRYNIFNDVDQIQFNDNAYNASGTIYLPDGSTGTGSLIGIFSQELDGGSSYPAPISLRTTDSSGWFIIYNTRLLQNNADMGTSAGDEILYHNEISEQACEEINFGLTGSRNIPDVADTGANTSDAHLSYGGAVFLNGADQIKSRHDIASFNLPICTNLSGLGRYVFIDLLLSH